jgi:hypothetical protein
MDDGELSVSDTGENTGRFGIDSQVSSGEMCVVSGGEVNEGVGITSTDDLSDGVAAVDMSIGVAGSGRLVSDTDEPILSLDLVLTRSSAWCVGAFDFLEPTCCFLLPISRRRCLTGGDLVLSPLE